MIYALLGAVFGVVGGMGLGGGIVLIPALTLLLGASQHSAQGMTLFAYLPMAIFALVSHFRQKNVRIKPALALMAFGCAGGAGGYFLAAAFDDNLLRTVFAVFLIITALLRVWRFELKDRLSGKNKNDQPKKR